MYYVAPASGRLTSHLGIVTGHFSIVWAEWEIMTTFVRSYQSFSFSLIFRFKLLRWCWDQNINNQGIHPLPLSALRTSWQSLPLRRPASAHHAIPTAPAFKPIPNNTPATAGPITFDKLAWLTASPWIHPRTSGDGAEFVSNITDDGNAEALAAT